LGRNLRKYLISTTYFGIEEGSEDAEIEKKNNVPARLTMCKRLAPDWSPQYFAAAYRLHRVSA